jgi:hypothetical protein
MSRLATGQTCLLLFSLQPYMGVEYRDFDFIEATVWNSNMHYTTVTYVKSLTDCISIPGEGIESLILMQFTNCMYFPQCAILSH